MFYMDIQSFDRDFDGRFQEIAQEVRLVRAIPAEIRRSADGRAEVIYQGPEEERITEAFDIVVLSVGMSPNPALTGLGDILGLTPNTEGFFGRDGEETITDQAGVFVAGAVQGPRSIQDSMNHAARTARSIALRLANRAAGGA
jgi:heterodisulfide reductase subunit A-like polyferredoxin